MNESQVFANVLKLAGPAERAAYLDEVCAGDPRLRADMEALLRAHGSDPGFLEQPAGSLGGTADIAPPGAPGEGPAEPVSIDQPGMVLAGRYKLLEAIGEGGMGAVWMAQQTEPVKRLVAVKLIKAGLASKAVLTRFEAEGQALALMDHPNIAKVLDAGTVGGVRDAGRGASEEKPSSFLSHLSPLDSRPFFVMELVKGVPITRYCDEHRLTPRQRLELFVPVCQAVQHAHQKGIIHRDLKPSNVLVALYDDRPVPKVIDFGVAKATGQQLTEQTLHTGFGAVVGTMEYMSPEQASFNQLDVDTRSDIYSLGVLLYELLTGSPPFTRKELEQAGMLEMLRLIREKEPSKPSTKLSTADGLPALAANRSTEPKRLTAVVRGELDWIVMKALEKDRSRRYETANAFAIDLQHYLHDEPVQACPPSTVYRLKKFVRRNKGVLATLAAVALAVVSAVVILAVSNVRISRETAEKDMALREKGEALAQAKVNYEEAQKQSKLAQQNAKRAEEQRGIAQANEKMAKAQTLLARRRFYASQMNLAMQAWRAGQTPRVLELLDGQRPHQGEEDLRAFEWYYLWRLCNGGWHRYLHEKAGVLSLAFAPDGKTLASAGIGIRFWDPVTGEEKRTLHKHSEVWVVAFSPDGKTVASGGQTTGTVTLWDASSGKPLHTIPESVIGLAFSPDGRTLAGGTTRGTKLWDVATAAERGTLGGPDGHKSWAVVGFLPDGKVLVTATDLFYSSKIQFWDLQTRTQRLTISVPDLYSAVLSPDGKRLATASGAMPVKLWDTATGKEQRAFLEADGFVLAFSPNGKKLATGGSSRTVTVWDVETGRRLAQDTHLDKIWSVAFSPDGRTLASATLGGTIKLWDMTAAEEVTTLPRTGLVTALRFSPDSKTLLVGNDGPTKLIDVAAGKEIAQVPARGIMAISENARVPMGLP